MRFGIRLHWCKNCYNSRNKSWCNIGGRSTWNIACVHWMNRNLRRHFIYKNVKLLFYKILEKLNIKWDFWFFDRLKFNIRRKIYGF